MAEIDGLGYMLEVLRRRISANSKRTGQVSSSSQTKTKSTSNASVKPKASVSELRQRIRERLRALPQDSGKNEEHATRVFLESVLLWEFGDDIAPNHELGDLVSNITSEMRSHPDIRRDLANLLGDLLRD